MKWLRDGRKQGTAQHTAQCVRGRFGLTASQAVDRVLNPLADERGGRDHPEGIL